MDGHIFRPSSGAQREGHRNHRNRNSTRRFDVCVAPGRNQPRQKRRPTKTEATKSQQFRIHYGPGYGKLQGCVFWGAPTLEAQRLREYEYEFTWQEKQ